MTAYERGDVVLVDTAFSGSVGSKRRLPSSSAQAPSTTRVTKLIFAAITGNISPPMHPGDTLLKDWTAAGLVRPSAVRGVLATIDTRDIIKTLGAVMPEDAAQVDAGVSSIIGYTLPAAE